MLNLRVQQDYNRIMVINQGSKKAVAKFIDYSRVNHHFNSYKFQGIDNIIDWKIVYPLLK